MDILSEECIEVIGAREHNLKNIHVKIPRNKLVVITGVSGSGKSSLAFDTIYSEGQRRYLETFSAYIRQFVGDLERPDVDKVNGLSPVIAIDQKTTSRNPRSTVGTTTDIYDFFRLLFAKVADAYSYVSGKKMEPLSEAEILNRITQSFDGKRIAILAPVIKGRKGHYREELNKIFKLGFKARIDGSIMDLRINMNLDRFKVHDIEMVVDQLDVNSSTASRLNNSVQSALKYGKNSIMILDIKTGKTKWYAKALMDPESDLSYDPPNPNSFSFNSPYGCCPKCTGLGKIMDVPLETLIIDVEKPLFKGAIPLLETDEMAEQAKSIKLAARENNISMTLPWKKLSQKEQNFLLFGEDFGAETDLESMTDAEKLAFAMKMYFKFSGIVNMLIRLMNNPSSMSMVDLLSPYVLPVSCPVCEGARLKKESLWFKLTDKNIFEVCSMDLSELLTWIEELPKHLTEKQKKISFELLKEIHTRVSFLKEVGLDYLNLNRPANSLSGGEAQRIRLATQIGSQLMGVTYILDEPSIGLHQRDNHKLIQSLKNLRDIGNTVLVVEHDKDMMLCSDFILDIGPKAGIHGGEVVSQGIPEDFLKQGSVTADFLSNRRSIQVPTERRAKKDKSIIIRGAKGHNLKNLTVEIPLGLMVCVTGVSGSGKSSLIRQTLYPILHQHAYGFKKPCLAYDAVEGLNHIDKVIEVDQSPIGRTPRSNPATYTGLFTAIRSLFSELPESKIRGYAPGRFSFNVKGGRCETCKGGGVQVIEMNFLPDVHVECPDCRGKRYNRETLEVRYKGKSISDVLNMTIDEGLSFFEPIPTIAKKLQTLQDVGLGYVTIGQSSTTLSGGEAQRMKIATELSKKDTGKTFYILDEPTTGLHFQDIEKLLEVLNRLVGKGNTILVIEHNLDVVKVSDWVIDIGPEGGSRGGTIVVEGTPETVALCEESHTGRFLKLELPENDPANQKSDKKKKKK